MAPSTTVLKVINRLSSCCFILSKCLKNPQTLSLIAFPIHHQLMVRLPLFQQEALPGKSDGEELLFHSVGGVL